MILLLNPHDDGEKENLERFTSRVFLHSTRTSNDKLEV